MIEINHQEHTLSLDLFTNKMTLLFDAKTELTQEKIIQLLRIDKTQKYYGIIGRDNNMIPFLSISDNLLLNIPKKSKHEFFADLNFFLEQFKLDSLAMSDAASNLSSHEQLVLQVSRGIILKQTIILFDQDENHHDSSQFLINIMPILNRISHKTNATIIICTANPNVANSPYYDQCLLVTNLL